MDKAKAFLFSDRGMALVNMLFLLAMFIRNSGIIFLAYAVWIFYLINCIKKAPSKAVKIVDYVFIGFAGVMIVVNLCLLLKIL